jgi:predicted transcriptional regulator
VPTSVRLDRHTERRLARLASRTGQSKSALLRQAIAVLDEQLDASPTIAEQLSDYVAAGTLGPRVLGRDAKRLLAAGFGRKGRP